MYRMCLFKTIVAAENKIQRRMKETNEDPEFQRSSVQARFVALLMQTTGAVALWLYYGIVEPL